MMVKRNGRGEMNNMQIHGLSDTFWVVTSPNRVSELGDICFACTFQQLMTQTRGGLHEKDIVGIFADEAEAKQLAMKLLGRNIVRTSDSMHRRGDGQCPDHADQTEHDRQGTQPSSRGSGRECRPQSRGGRLPAPAGGSGRDGLGRSGASEPPHPFRMSCIAARFEDLWSS